VVPIPLSDDELRIVRNPEDIPFLEMIKGMSMEELRAFDRYLLRDVMDYNRMQSEWVKTQTWLLGHKLQREPSVHDLVHEMGESASPLRFRAFYVMKHPDRVTPISDRVTAAC
jgi:hypothetical protein